MAILTQAGHSRLFHVCITRPGHRPVSAETPAALSLLGVSEPRSNHMKFPLMLMACPVGTLIAISGLAMNAAGGAQPKTPQQPADLSSMMSKMEELGKVGPNHAIINQFIGTWETKTKVWCPMMAEPVESSGTMNVRGVHDGRFVICDYKGNMAMPGPDGKPKETPFTGTMIWGYSNADQQYQTVWIDSMNTSVMSMTGSAGEDKDVVKLTGECKGPDTSGTMVRRTNSQTIKKLLGDKYVSEFWSEGPSEPKHKTMEITFTKLGIPAP
jgi:hypothetical protein